MKQIKYIFILLSLLNLTAKADELPEVGELNETYLTTKQEQRLGKEFIKEVRLNFPILNDAIINDYIQSLGNKLAQNANTKRKNFHFFVVKDPNVNAFAGPAAYIGINSGTIIAANSESELAAVIAHEIAHVTQHHIEHLINSAQKTQMAAMAGVLAASIIGATSKNRSMGELASGTAMASMGGAVQHMINFTREHEREADNIGMRILSKSSFDPHAMPNFFAREQRLKYNYHSDIPKFLLTHPVTSERIAEAKNRAELYNFKNSKPQNTFKLVKIRTQVLTTNNLIKLQKRFKTKLATKKWRNSNILQYGYALTLYKNHNYQQADKILSNLQKKYPTEILFQMLAAQLALDNKQGKNALAILEQAVKKNPPYYPLIIQYCQTLIATNQPQKASDFILAKTKKYTENSELYLLLAQAYAQNKQKVDAYQAKAKAYEIDGYNRQAIVLLQQALKIPKLSANNSAIINAKIERLKTIEKNL